MLNDNSLRKKLYIRRIVLKLILVMYDVMVINVSFILTLYVRFYVAKEMHAGSIRFFELFTHYTPFYTLFCIIVFACFKLYNGMWKYAGFHDMNRIVVANIACLLGHVLGTILFIQRMPRSFYLIGGLLQLCLVGLVRFAYKIIEIEKNLLFCSSNMGIRTMIIGIDGSTRCLIRRLESETNIHPLFIVDYEGIGMGAFFDGIPVVNGVDKLEEAIRKYDVNHAIFASYSLPGELSKQIRKTCLEHNVEVEDYYDKFFDNIPLISYRELVDKINGNLKIIYNNVEVKDEDNLTYMNEINHYKIIGLSASNDIVCLHLSDKRDRKLDLNEEWIKEQESKTGEEISFF